MLLLFLVLLGSLVLYEQMKVNVGISIANQPDLISLKPHRIRIMLVYSSLDDETPAVISIEILFRFVKQVYVLPNLVIYFLHQ
jgi:hypothetical protein